MRPRMQDPTFCWMSIYWSYMSLIFSVIKAMDGLPMWMNKDQSALRCLSRSIRIVCRLELEAFFIGTDNLLSC